MMNDRAITLRPFRPDEVEDLRRLEQAARSRYAGLPGFEPVANAPPIAGSRFSAGDGVVAEAGCNRAGYVLMQPLDGMMYVANIMVLPGMSGGGIGAALLGAVGSAAEARGFAGITLTTFRTPPWNGPWFRRHGFSPMPDERIGPGLAAILARHATVLDMTTRETLWLDLSCGAAASAGQVGQHDLPPDTGRRHPGFG